MRERDLAFLACPGCLGDLAVQKIQLKEGERWLEARLVCVSCGQVYPVIRGIPRFAPEENYAANFGLEWLRHSRSQYDSYSGMRISEGRFFEETGWRKDLTGERILEVGSGSGRFTEQAARTGADVVSVDYSAAVEANYQSNGRRDNVMIVQGDVYRMPFRPGTFDKVFCFGMLQHTPDVRGAFMALPPMLKGGGELVVDVYTRSIFSTFLATKYYVRPFTRTLKPERLYELTRRWVDALWPICLAIAKIPKIGPSLNWRLLVADHSALGLKGEILKEWAYLDTFDMLSPRYDSPQRPTTIRDWFRVAEMTDIVVKHGHNGLEGRGKRRPVQTGVSQA